MPWAPSEASSHTKAADTNKLKLLWADVANKALKRGKSDVSAIRQANAAVRNAGGGST